MGRRGEITLSMMGETALLIALIALSGCGASAETASSSTTPAPTDRAAPTASSWQQALAPLRPAGAEDLLAALQRDPRDPMAYARGAAFYAGTDAGGMTILWGLTRAAMAPDSMEDPELARVMASVLRERVTTTRTGPSTRSVSVRLAPGATPAIARPDGSMSAPLAHVFELTFTPALAPFEGEWSLRTIAAVLALYVSIIARGSPLDERVELHAWLTRIAAAGHLEAFVHAVFGAAFPEERAAFDATALEAMRAYVTESPLRPSWATMPDDLVPIR